MGKGEIERGGTRERERKRGGGGGGGGERERERERVKKRENIISHCTSIQEAIDRHARMQFTLQLSSNIQDPRKPVQLQQNRVR